MDEQKLKVFWVSSPVPGFEMMSVPGVSEEDAVTRFLDFLNPRRRQAGYKDLRPEECEVKEFSIPEGCDWSYSFGPNGYTIIFTPRRARGEESTRTI